jgi:hypothetical protein
LASLGLSGVLEHSVSANPLDSQRVELIPARAAWQLMQQSSEAAYLFLLLTALASEGENPWRSVISLKGSELLSLFDWSRDLEGSRTEQLQRMAQLLQFICNQSVLLSQIDPQNRRFTLTSSPLWVLERLEFSGDLHSPIWEAGKPETEPEITPDRPIATAATATGHPADLFIQVRPGCWSQGLLSGEARLELLRLLDYGVLAKNILRINPNRKRLAARLALFLGAIGKLQTLEHYCVVDLLEQIESEKNLLSFYKTEDSRTRLFIRWNNTLQSLKNLGWQIQFDPETYPEGLRPTWSHGDEEQTHPIGRFQNWFETWIAAQIAIAPPTSATAPTPDLRSSDRRAERFNKNQLILRPKGLNPVSRMPAMISGQALDVALTLKGWSKAHLAAELQMDRSMVTHWIKGSRPISPEQRKRLWKVLGKELQAAQKINY